MSSAPEPGNVTLFGNRVSVDVTKDLEIILEGPKSNMSVLLGIKRDTGRGGGQGKVRQSYRDTATRQGMPGAPRSWKRWERPFPGALGGRTALPATLSCTSGIQKVRESISGVTELVITCFSSAKQLLQLQP
jgi:hypothetical protein